MNESAAGTGDRIRLTILRLLSRFRCRRAQRPEPGRQEQPPRRLVVGEHADPAGRALRGQPQRDRLAAAAAVQEPAGGQQQPPGRPAPRPRQLPARTAVPRPGPPDLPLRRGPADDRIARRTARRLTHSKGRPHGGQTAGDAPLQHGQVRQPKPGHAPHIQARPRAALRAQHRAAAVRQVCARAVAGHRFRAPIEAKAVG